MMDLEPGMSTTAMSSCSLPDPVRRGNVRQMDLSVRARCRTVPPIRPTRTNSPNRRKPGNPDPHRFVQSAYCRMSLRRAVSASLLAANADHPLRRLRPAARRHRRAPLQLRR
ncbi:hypothetical protein GCM10010317_016720 [Streptomyces mirabilis]|nr:hypothetical protein GCM10010317_016720 [Streptomyces mirabilis]